MRPLDEAAPPRASLLLCGTQKEIELAVLFYVDRRVLFSPLMCYPVRSLRSVLSSSSCYGRKSRTKSTEVHCLNKIFY